MKTIVIETCSYPVFQKIRDFLYDPLWGVSHDLYGCDYSPNLSVGVFHFKDNGFIPEPLKKFIVEPNTTKKKKDRLNQGIENVLGEHNLTY